MASKFFALTTLAAWASAAAIPATPSATCEPSEFSLAMRVDDSLVSLNAIETANSKVLNLVAGRPSVYPGTPLFSNGTSPDAGLVLNLDGNQPFTNSTGEFPLFVADVGEVYGSQVPVSAQSGFSYNKFTVSNGTVLPMLTAASQSWYACNVTLGGVDHIALSWGVYNSNGSAPDGCVATVVEQNFNVPCTCDE